MPINGNEKAELPGLGTGAYSYATAAALLRVNPRRVRAWADGYSYTVLSGRKQSSPILQRPVAILGLLTFRDLVELWWVKAFVDNQVRLPKVRKAAERLAARLETPYPFAHRELFGVHGSELLDFAFDGHYEIAHTGQLVFDYVALFVRPIEFDHEITSAWHPVGFEHIVVSSRRSFGAPIVESCGIRTDIIYGTYMAENQDADGVAEWYGITPADVHDAVQFEAGWIRAA